ncbi:hypothetical protein C8R47DRAFT_1215991 [Mycena vitilis]|nr:hypothetical protein C8R47DRAFT_1215991 [Mycena vitilis]
MSNDETDTFHYHLSLAMDANFRLKPKFHGAAHTKKCQTSPIVASDGERNSADANGWAKGTRETGPGQRHDVLDDPTWRNRWHDPERVQLLAEEID